MEELGYVVNFDYEAALFDPAYQFDLAKFKKMRSRFEYLYLLCAEEKPLFSESHYSDAYLTHLGSLGFKPPPIVNRRGPNWVGELRNLELERKFNSKYFSSQLRKELFRLEDSWVIESKNDLKSIPSLESYLLKDPYSFAGIGQRIVDKVEFTKACIVEKLYNRILDFSVHKDGDIFLNLNNKQGNFRGIVFSPDCKFKVLEGFENEIQRSLDLVKRVMPESYDFSIDMFLYKENRNICLHPLVEINMRKTMNIVGRRLPQFATEKLGVWSLKDPISNNAIQIAPEFSEKSYLQLMSEDEIIKYLKYN